MITDEQRHQLFTRAQDVFGREEAAIFMEAISPISITDFAGLKTDIAGLDHRMDLMGADMRLMEMRLDTRFSKQTTELQRTFVTWLLTSQTTVVVAVALMLSLR